jgi:DNA-binding NarL/FixJ family response regulator
MSVADGGPKLIRVVVAEDHHSMRDRLRTAVDAEPDMVCVGLATDRREALELTLEALPDVLVIDAKLDGIAVVLRLRRLAPQVRTILYDTEHTLPELAGRMHLAGVVATGASVDELVPAVRSAASEASTRM